VRATLPAAAALCAGLAAAGLLACSPADPPPADRDAILTEGTALYSQQDEELIIRHFFGDERGGFFVDVGSFHPKKMSTTYYLEAHLGWQGIAIDAMPGLEELYTRLRPGTRFFHYAVSDTSGEHVTLHIAGGLSSLDPRHVKRLPGGDRVETVPVEVETITLNRLLDANGVERIDFLSMDIEGHEPKALAGFDIERFHPRLVCIEATPRIRKRIRHYFGTHGYERIERYLAHDQVNWYFTPKS
jgi:FkbM family methyltransferase